jgi:hypothetical protein
MPKGDTLRPGQIVDRSGIYKDDRTGETTTFVHGKVTPPTPKPGSYWQEIVDSRPKGPTHTGPRRKG